MEGFHLRGYVRLDYAPFWYGCGWLFEDVERELRKLDRRSRSTWRRRTTELPRQEGAPGIFERVRAFAGTRRKHVRRDPAFGGSG